MLYDSIIFIRCLPGLDGVSAAQTASNETMEQKLKELKDGLWRL